MIVPFAAGGPTDIVARIGEHMQKIVGGLAAEGLVHRDPGGHQDGRPAGDLARDQLLQRRNTPGARNVYGPSVLGQGSRVLTVQHREL